MPKIVDPEERRRAIVEAVFVVVARDGLARASLRSIAAEARLAIGSVRHYCGSQQEIRELAVEALSTGFEDRFRAHLADLPAVQAGALPRRALAQRALEELLPLDERRRSEMAVSLEFTVAARTDPSVGPQVARLRRGMVMVIARILAGLEQAQALRDGVQVEVEIDRLAALLDGLALRGLDPEELSPQRARDVLVRHLDDILEPTSP
ncbi:MAG: TetR/AcrR family transcriptional regulator [Brachybacterium tyrofermentans]|uniref:TetR/AcrR family transcriptional regulator n=1 Tax=Brachybacterium tyrofermentans TaxID=47848 RepID=A0ABW0FHD1_9MICO|nr:TetR/AcrR family transcriptional regulator [Brachybacterium tyrofermentans]SLN04177.1 Transcriptional regulator, TetR family [Corynebacterium xerosis]